MRYTAVIWLLSLALLTASEPLAERLLTAAAAQPCLRVAFVQDKDLALFDEPLRTPGVIEIDRTRGALRWEFTGHAVFVFADQRLRKWDADGHEDSQPDRDPGVQALRGQMQALLTGDLSALAALFTIVELTDGDPGLELIPRDAALQRFITRVELRFAPDLAPRLLILDGIGDDRTTYRFAAAEAVTVIAPARFSGP